MLGPAQHPLAGRRSLERDAAERRPSDSLAPAGKPVSGALHLGKAVFPSQVPLQVCSAKERGESGLEPRVGKSQILALERKGHFRSLKLPRKS